MEEIIMDSNTQGRLTRTRCNQSGRGRPWRREGKTTKTGNVKLGATHEERNVKEEQEIKRKEPRGETQSAA